jgi:hypothetical protein
MIHLIILVSFAVEHDVLKNVRVSAPGGDFTLREVFYLVYCPKAVREDVYFSFQSRPCSIKAQ